MSITLRVRAPDKVTTITVPQDATLYTLKQRIAEAVAIPASQQDLRFGFPPTALVSEDESTRLDSLGIKTGEQIIIARGEAKTEPTRSPPPSPAPFRTAPRSPAARNTSPKLRTVPVQDGGALVLRQVADDNSCLFTSVGIVLQTGDSQAVSRLRKLVADTVQSDPVMWSTAVLGQSPIDYARTIQKPATWGGAIELSIFASAFLTELWSIDVATSRVDRFGEGQGYERAAMVVYSGIHYDALTLTPAELLQAGGGGGGNSANLDFDTTSFSIADGQADAMLVAAKRLVDEMRKDHAYTDTATFLLRCQQCQTGIKGEREARTHAEQTGHTQFGECDE